MKVKIVNELKELDGHNLYYAFMAGARKVIAHQTELNRINVFPVRDGDTGTNLAATIRSVSESIHPHKSYKVTADRIAEATLLNARGNSGIIFAQFFYGLSTETGEWRSVTLQQFAQAIGRSVSYVYDAVSRPVEGTMLTVIRELAEYVSESWHRFSDFNHLLSASYEVLKRSLQETKLKLEILKKNNVVDAGAKGFVLFFEGIIEYLKRRNIRELLISRTFSKPLAIPEETVSGEIEFRYCTEAMIRDCNTDRESLTRLAEAFGNSLVIAGSGKMLRLHVHTNDPAKLFERLRSTGTITFQKADDMVRHYQIANERKWKIALVTDSTCDLGQDLLDNYQVNVLPININFGENHYLDKVTLKPEQFYDMLKDSAEYPRSAQVNETTLANLYSHLASHYDSIIAVHLSDGLSGTYNASRRAALKIGKEFGKKISVLDSKNLSGSLGLIVLRIARSIEEGRSHDEIVRAAESWIHNTKIFVSVRTLSYMVRGGRVSATRGLLAKLLNINPVVSINSEGKAVVFDKTFGQKANMRKVMHHIREIKNKNRIWNYVVLHACNPSAANWYAEKMEELTGLKPVSVVNISPVIGANAGLGAASVAVLYD